MKRWVWYLLLGILVSALLAGGVIYGVITHKEPGLMLVCWKGGHANYAMNCEELKWQKAQMPLKYHIAFGEDHRGYVESVIKAAEMWNREIGPVFERVKDPAKAIVHVTWGSIPNGSCAAGHVAHHGYDGPKKVDLVLNEPSDTHAVYRFAAHEFGHVLGLAHDESKTSIMHPAQPGVTKAMTFVLPSDHDKKLLRGLYR